MSARVVNGWLVVSYDGSDQATVEISTERDVWQPAFLDYDAGKRVAKVRPPASLSVVEVKLRANGHVTSAGWLRL